MSRQQVRLRAEPPAVGAARALRWIHDAYRDERARATQTATVELEDEERRYRQRGWLTRSDRARHRAQREELRSRGVEVPPWVPKQSWSQTVRRMWL